MSTITFRLGLLAAASMTFAGVASAQTPNGFASIVHVPLVVKSASYTSTIFVHNPGGAAVDVQFNYTGAAITATPGAVDCGLRSIPAGTTVQYDFATICPLNGASNFGSMRIYETSSSTRPISVYVRQESAQGDGFSVEGFPIGNFANDVGLSLVTGLRRQAAAPTYQSNCFVASLGEPVTVDVALYDGANVQVGTTQTVSVAAGDSFRLLDVFKVAGAPDGDLTNVRAEFRQNAASVGNPSFVGFCTVQNNTTFDGDFRIAKTVAPDDATLDYASNVNKDGLGNKLDIPPASKQVFAMYVRHPDFVACRIVGDGRPNAELRLIDPAGKIVAGGDDINEFGEYFTGEKSTVNGGSNGLWRVEVGSRDGLGELADKFHVQCNTGNGATSPLLIATLPDDF